LGTKRIAVVGAGIGGLVAALELAAAGLAVTVFERASAPGGKLGEAEVDGRRLDAGPTVFTLRPIFEAVFQAAGTSLDAELKLRPLDVLARHAWGTGGRLDLFADPERSAEAVAAFAGLREAQGFRRFRAAARRTYETLEEPFMRAAEPSMARLIAGAGFGGLPDLWRINPYVSLWQALGGYFQDARLRQLFARYATYCGSSPFQAPATLMLVAHVEAMGVWSVEGGIARVAETLARLAAARGARFAYGAEVAGIGLAHGRAASLTLSSGERVAADAVIVNADVGALAAGLLGRAAAGAAAPVAREERSLSALTFAMVAKAEGFPLSRHNVFFAPDYAAEFDDIFRRRRLPSSPTVYVCAEDREGGAGSSADGRERLLMIVNAPPDGDQRSLTDTEIRQCEASAFTLLETCGLSILREGARTAVTTPADFERRFPGTGGALYGRASHGWRAAFRRSGVRTPVPGLYLAGGSVHPGAGMPMAALSGRLAAASLLSDLASTAQSRGTAMLGGMSMH